MTEHSPKNPRDEDESEEEMRELYDFEEESRRRPVGPVGQIWGFVSEKGRWWMIPILIALLLVGLLLVLGSTGAGVFIYPLF